MKARRITIMFLLSILCLCSLAGCGKSSTPRLANTLTFSLEGISDLTISYDDENVSFFESDDDDLIVKEYMTENKKSYHADVKQKSGSIQIREGGKPVFKKGFSRYIEVYLPASYNENLAVSSTDGNLDMTEVELSLSKIRIDTTSGMVKLQEASAADIHLSSTKGSLELGTVTAEKIKIETTQGEVDCERLEGLVTYTSTSGNISVKSAKGSGTYRADNSGKLSVVYESVTGDLSFYNKNDNVELTLPDKLSFTFEAVTKNGSISTDFQENISIKDKTAKGTVGEHPSVKVKAETKNGNIHVTQ